jgi:hypothetical protein
MSPDGLTDEQFESQLNIGFDREIALWKRTLEDQQNYL